LRARLRENRKVWFSRREPHSHSPCVARENGPSLERLGEYTMFRAWKLAIALGILYCFALVSMTPARAQAPKPKGLGDPGSLTALKIEPNINDKGVAIRGRDSRQQIFVTGAYTSGQFRDFTRKVAYTSEPAGIVKIDAGGMVTPLTDGTTTVTAKDAAS